MPGSASAAASAAARLGLSTHPGALASTQKVAASARAAPTASTASTTTAVSRPHVQRRPRPAHLLARPQRRQRVGEAVATG